MKFTSITILAVTAALAACVTPKADRHIVNVTSSPPGALVSHDEKQCVTPCVLDVRDNFGFLSSYDFSFTLDGYQTQVISFKEQTVFHGQGVVPNTVHVDMQR